MIDVHYGWVPKSFIPLMNKLKLTLARCNFVKSSAGWSSSIWRNKLARGTFREHRKSGQKTSLNLQDF